MKIIFTCQRKKKNRGGRLKRTWSRWWATTEWPVV